MNPRALVTILALAVCACSATGQTGKSRGKAKTMDLSRQDLEQILQHTIDLEALDRYYHAAELAERKPLRILRNDAVPEPLALTKFGQPVEFAKLADLAGKPYLEITGITHEKGVVTVAFRYRVEGIRGTATLDKSGAAWRVTGHRIVEN